MSLRITTPEPLSGLVIKMSVFEQSDLIAWKHSRCIEKSDQCSSFYLFIKKKSADYEMVVINNDIEDLYHPPIIQIFFDIGKANNN